MFEANCSKQMGQCKKMIFHQMFLYKDSSPFYCLSSIKTLVFVFCDSSKSFCVCLSVVGWFGEWWLPFSCFQQATRISRSGLVSCSATVGTSCLNCSADLGNKTLKYCNKTLLLKLLKEKTEKYTVAVLLLRSVRKCPKLCCIQDSASKD